MPPAEAPFPGQVGGAGVAVKVIDYRQARARMALGLVQRARGAFVEREFDAARQLARRAARLEPRLPAAQLVLGDALCAEGLDAQALGCYHRARRLAPEEAAGWWAVSTLHALAGRWRLARRYLEDAQRRLKRGDGLLFEYVAQDLTLVLCALGRFAEARAAVHWGLRRRPSSPSLRQLSRRLGRGTQSRPRPRVPPDRSQVPREVDDEDRDS
jgi:tetratricopeptide (TPR) repeat protein